MLSSRPQHKNIYLLSLPLKQAAPSPPHKPPYPYNKP